MKQILTFISFILIYTQMWSQDVLTHAGMLLNECRYQEAEYELQSRKIRKLCTEKQEQAQRMELLGEAAVGLCKYETAIEWFKKANELYSHIPQSSEKQAWCSRRITDMLLHLDILSLDEITAQVIETIDLYSKCISNKNEWYNALPQEKKKEEAETFCRDLDMIIVSMNLLIGKYALEYVGDYESALDYCKQNEKKIPGTSSD